MVGLTRFIAFLAFALTTVTGLILNAPSNPTPKSGGTTTVTWTQKPSDPPTWTLFLVNQTQFLTLFKSWEDVDGSTGSLKVTLPVVTHYDKYAFHAVNSSSVDFVLASSPVFAL